MNIIAATQSIGRLSILKFFPADPGARNALIQMVCEMANSNAEVDWLVKRTMQLFNEFPGPLELRAVFCSKFKPKDGVEAVSALDRFADGVPSEKPERNIGIGPGERIALPGKVETLDAETQALIDSLAVKLSMDPAIVRNRLRNAPRVDDAEIARLKAEQDRNRKESVPEPEPDVITELAKAKVLG